MKMVMSDPKNRGFHVVVAGRLFKAKTGEGASKP